MLFCLNGQHKRVPNKETEKKLSIPGGVETNLLDVMPVAVTLVFCMVVR